MKLIKAALNRSSAKQPEVIVFDAGDEPITMPSLCMNCYDNVRERNSEREREIGAV